MKPTSTFKLNKQTKQLLATILDPQERAIYKSNMIQAQLASEVVANKKSSS